MGRRRKVLYTTDKSELEQEKPHFFSARILAFDYLKIAAILNNSNSTYTEFLMSIINTIDWHCKTGKDYYLEEVFGREFYHKYIVNYLSNLNNLENSFFENKKEKKLDDRN